MGLSKPRYTYKEILTNETPTVEEWNETLEDISEDLKTLYQERIRIGDLSRLTFNYNQTLVNELTERAARTASKVIDLRILSGQLQEHAIVGGDDFNDGSRIDPGFAREYPRAEIVPGQGIMTLQRVESTKTITEDDDVTVNPLTPGVTRSEKAELRPNVKRFYEGHFYDYIGRSRPEGGIWNLEEKLIDPEQDSEGYSITRISSQFSTATNEDNSKAFDAGVEDGSITTAFYNTDGTAASTADSSGFTDLRNENDTDLRPGEPISVDDIRVVDLGATPEELSASRARMVDNSADSFWECEYVIPRDQPQSGTPTTGFGSVVLPNRDPHDLDENGNPLVSLSAVDKMDLDVEVIVRFAQGPQKVNFITLNPYEFEQAAWLEVYDVATAPSQDSPFETIPGFGQGLFQNTLTDEANEELDEGTFKTTLAPTRYSYRGQGVWTFPVREVEQIRFKIRQKAPIFSDYQVMNIQLRRTLTRTRNDLTLVRDDTRVVKLSYLQTIQAQDDRQFQQEVSGVTGGGSSSGTNVQHKSRPLWQKILDPLSIFSSDKTVTTSISHSDSGWQVIRTWFETKRNMARYSIGIRDIGAFGYRYAESSEVVSVPFSSPKEVMKVQLRVDQIIPDELPIDRQWIQYFVSVDEGNEWLAINPLDHPTAFADDGSIVPYTYSFNLDTAGPQADGVTSMLTENPVRSIRFRAVFRTDPSIQDGDRVTPVLKSYRVLMYPRGGLTDAGF